MAEAAVGRAQRWRAPGDDQMRCDGRRRVLADSDSHLPEILTLTAYFNWGARGSAFRRRPGVGPLLLRKRNYFADDFECWALIPRGCSAGGLILREGVPVSSRWYRVADELRAIAADRSLAAAHEPVLIEERLLRREAALLTSAAALASSGNPDVDLDGGTPRDGAGERGGLALWGLSADGEAALRALAANPSVDPEALDPHGVLAAILGVPPGD